MTDSEVQIISKAQQALNEAKTPAQSKAVEAMASAARAWAKEQSNYEMLIAAAHVWIMARRKTTELIQPNINHGGNFQGNNVVTLNDYGFTKMQWNRRVRELAISEEDITAYFDDCIAKAWEPTLFGLHLWKDRISPSDPTGDDDPEPERCTCPTCGQMHRRFRP